MDEETGKQFHLRTKTRGWTQEEIENMTMKEYAVARQSLLTWAFEADADTDVDFVPNIDYVPTFKFEGF